jgi:hypothetical protein
LVFGEWNKFPKPKIIFGTDQVGGASQVLGVALDWLFQTPERAQRMMTSFEEQFYDQLLEIQAMLNSPIDGNIDDINEYHLAWLFRRGVTTHAQNQGVAVPHIDWINHWGQERSSGNMTNASGLLGKEATGPKFSEVSRAS